MDNDVAISVEHVSKKYCKALKKSMLYGMTDIGRNIVGASSRSGRLRKDEFWALSNISFEVPRGESFGLIGPNGSGKTTLLKMLNGIFWPDTGNITVNGRVGALIAVGAGFHPLFSGRENIYINGAILGMSEAEIREKFDAIVAFADIGDFLDAPVKTYSSGMYVRLGFSVAVHCEPEILLVDEILAVGDKDFQLKCFQKMNEIRRKGTTIILVAHNEYVIREYTDRCLYLLQGQERFLGPSEEGISVYIRDTLERKSRNTPVQTTAGANQPKKAELLGVNFYDAQGRETNFLESGQELNIALRCAIHQPLSHPIFGVNFYDKSGFVYCANSAYEGQTFNGNVIGEVCVKIRIPQFHLPTNNYVCSVVVAEESPDNLIDWHNMAYRFVVGRATNARGSIKLPTEWKITGVN